MYVKKSALLLYSPLVTFVRLAAAWGATGHEAVAYIAQDFVSSSTASYVKNILGDTSTSYMANAATWADSYRATSAGSWSGDLHFVDANDSPPSSCSVNFNRDCDNGFCVISAISNYTAQLLSSSTSTANRLNALRFVIHFVGDVHQPLHDEALDIGGNSIDVTYGGSNTNLHSVWDTSILSQLAGGNSITAARSFATSMTSAIKAKSYGWSPSSWLSGISTSQAQNTALSWASEANKYVCSDVIPDGVDAVESGDLKTDGYYDDHYHAVRIQIARAGYRLAAWLDLIVDGSTGL